MARYRATLAYDGTAYQGFQRQRDGIATVQAAVEEALARVGQVSVSITAAGRTDSGVHAVGQVIAFDLDWRHSLPDLLRALNALLPDDIALRDLSEARAGFHPRFDALARRYRYRVFAGPLRDPLTRHYTWQVQALLDLNAMQAAAAKLVGRHDFAAFGHPPQGTNTVRDLFVSQWSMVEVPAMGAEAVYTVEATAFLHHQVRRMVGMMVDIGRGHLSISDFVSVFASANLANATTLAPPQGLCLEKVRYPDDS